MAKFYGDQHVEVFVGPVGRVPNCGWREAKIVKRVFLPPHWRKGYMVAFADGSFANFDQQHIRPVLA
jgi:hypothetical protein